MWSAVCDYTAAARMETANGGRAVDFADALIVRKAMVASRRAGEPCEGTYTFDKAAQQLAGTKPL